MARIPFPRVVHQYRTFLGGFLTGFGCLATILLLLQQFAQRDVYAPFYRDRSMFPFSKDHPPTDTHHAMLNTTLADQLRREIRILCVVTTQPGNHFKKAVHVKSTWGQRCTTLLFMSTQEEPLLPTVKLTGKEDRAHLWGKTKQAMQHVYQNYQGQYDWVYKADDDTYAVMENLRYLLHYHNNSEPLYFGCEMKYQKNDQLYMSGGAGYVLSKEALRRFIEEGLSNASLCQPGNVGDEDVEMGRCLTNVGVRFGDTFDREGRYLFTPVYVNQMLIPGVMDEVNWYMQMMQKPSLQGLRCCSDNLISTHYVLPHQLYLLEYLIYHVTPFGRAYVPTLPTARNTTNRQAERNWSQLKWENYD